MNAAPPQGEIPNLLEIKDLKTVFEIEGKVIRAADGVNLSVAPGEILGIVGESGCGKSVTALSVLRLIEKPGRILSGEVLFGDRDLLRLNERELQRIRGKEIAYIFQQPHHALNPVFTAGKQIDELYRLHASLAAGERKTRIASLFDQVGIPCSRISSYPYELSGGQAQRVMIAMALALDPALIIADEPTTALDVTMEAEILGLMLELREKRRTALMLITHDIGVIAETADRVAVMYAGVVVETAEVCRLFADPLHPYTAGLLRSAPRLGHIRDELEVIPGSLPDPSCLPSGCRFAERCEKRCSPLCLTVEPELKRLPDGREIRCHAYPG